jgi:hypothetical protein
MRKAGDDSKAVGEFLLFSDSGACFLGGKKQTTIANIPNRIATMPPIVPHVSIRNSSKSNRKRPAAP